MSRGIVFIFLYLSGLILLTVGCAGLKETAKKVVGVSTQELENGRSTANKKSYPLGYQQCRDMVEAALKQAQVYVYHRDESKKMIAFYMTQADTTPVGVFFVPQDESSTSVEVASPSRYSKEYISGRISSYFDKAAADAREKEKPADASAVISEIIQENKK